jgi:hypothetical protein
MGEKDWIYRVVSGGWERVSRMVLAIVYVSFLAGI